MTLNQQTAQQQTYTPNPLTQQYIQQALGMGAQAATAPFAMPQQPVAGFTPLQQQYFSTLQGLQGMATPYFQQGAGLIGQGAGLAGRGAGFIDQGGNLISQGAAGVGTGQGIMAGALPSIQAAGTAITPEDIQHYLNPYAQSALANMQKYVFDPQRVQTMGQATQMAGGVGADRLGLVSQNLDKTQADAVAQAEAGFYQNAAQIAEQQKQQQLAAGLGQVQTGAGYGQLGLGMGGLGSQMGGLGGIYGGLGGITGGLGTQLGGMGAGMQTAALQGAGALGAAGTQQQQLAQAQLMAPYNQQLAALAYPFQTSQFLAGLTGGLAPALGGTTAGTGTTFGTQMPTQPAMASQILGLGAGLIGGLGQMGAFGGFGGFGGSTPSNLSFDTSSLGGGDMFSYVPAKLGGRIRNPFARGGDVEDSKESRFPDTMDVETPVKADDATADSDVPQVTIRKMDIPHFNLPMGSGQQTGAKLNLPLTQLGFPQQQQQQQAQSSGGGKGSSIGADIGTAIGIGAKFLPMLLAARGGPVNPFDIYRGFQEGGGADEEIDDTAGEPLEEESLGLGQRPNWSPMQERAPELVAKGATPQTFDTGELPPAAKLTAQHTADMTQPAGGAGINAARYMLPREQMPYPQANQPLNLRRLDAGSPLWPALMAAGAKMGSSTQPFMAAISQGFGAAGAEVEAQKKELKSEEDLNLKAEHYFKLAQSEADKYNLKTPHQIATESETARYHDIMDQYRRDALQQRQEAGTALQRNAKWLIDNKIAKNPQEAFEMAHSGINEASRYNSAVEAAKKTLLNTPEGAGMSGTQLELAARALIADRFPNSRGLAPAVPPTQTKPPMDLPPDQSQLIPGQQYNTKRGIATWDGTKFVQ